MSRLAGAVVWAVVPFAPEPPFRLWAGAERDPVEVPSPAPLIKAARRSESEFTFLVPGKARPVLVLSDGYDERIGELLALRLLRLGKLPEEGRQLIREQRDASLFYLDPDRFNLPEENAAMVAGLVRVPHTALDTTPVGRLDRDGLRTLHERVAHRYQLDLHRLVLSEIRRLAEQRSRSET